LRYVWNEFSIRPAVLFERPRQLREIVTVCGNATSSAT
jgi:hypothetical protein